MKPVSSSRIRIQAPGYYMLPAVWKFRRECKISLIYPFSFFPIRITIADNKKFYVQSKD